MAPRMHLFTAFRRLAVNPAAQPQWASRSAALTLNRGYAGAKSRDLPVADEPAAGGPNMNQGEHVSEEAAKMAKMTGGTGPDLSQGTPVQDILKEDAEARKDAPKVIKDSIRAGQTPPKPQSRPFSTCSRRRLEQQQVPASMSDYSVQVGIPAMATAPSYPSAPEQVSPSSMSGNISTPSDPGHKFGLPELPLPPRMHKDYRYEPIVEQVTNLLMRHGEKATAQRNVSYILRHLRTAPPPVYNPSRPLLPGAPPASHLPLNPVLYLTLALDSLAPLLRLRSQRGAAGGGQSLQIPVPLSQKQRRRQAFVWIKEAASKKQNKGTGAGDFARRVAEEMVAIVEGRSTLWERRTNLHKVATTARVNLNFSGGRSRRR